MGGSRGLGGGPAASGGAPGASGGTSGGSGGALGGVGGNHPGSGGGAGAGQAGTGGSNGAGGVGGATADCTPLAPIARRLLALRPAQYGNATRDLLGLAATPAVVGSDTLWAASDAANFFIDGNHLYAYYAAAGAMLDQTPPRVGALAQCEAAETEVECATRFARTFGRLAFRRALDDVEVADVMKVFATVCPAPSAVCASEADFTAAITLMVKAFILAPSFLYRTELGPRNLTANAAGVYPDTTMTGDEIATQLAFVLLGSTPDAELLAAADSGALGSAPGILSQVDRLLALPTARTQVADLVTSWLGVDRLPQRTKDPALLAVLPTPDRDLAVLAADLRTSWEQSLSETLWANPPGKLTDLLTSQTFFADGRLATLYGLPPAAAPAATFNRLAWPAGQPRAGILTHPAFLWATSDPSNVSIVKRGETIHHEIVCEDTVAPEPLLDNAAAMAVIATGDSEATKSDARLASGKLCADSCHSELDSYGRLLHAFDAIGNYRTVDEVGRPIDPTATLTDRSPLGAMTVSGPVAFAQALISTKVFSGCAVQRLLEATAAVPIPVRNSCQVNDLRAAFNQSDGTMVSLMRALATSDFAHARAGGTQ